MDLAIELQRRFACSLLRAPTSVLRAIAGPERRSPEGYVLDLQTQVILRVGKMLGSTEWTSRPLAEARKLMIQSSQVLNARPTAPFSIRDRWIPVDGGAVGARMYVPIAQKTGPRPIVVYYHGGGFVLGSLDSHDGECRALAAETGAIVVAIDYRLAPEHRFPTAAKDAIAAFRWVAQNAVALGGDPARIAVAGDSAGGNLSAVVALETRGDAVRPMFQLLVYPATDMTRSHPSHRYFCEDLLLTEASIDSFLANYLRSDEDQRDPLASPLFATDHTGLPPAMVLTAGFDPLRDEGKAYADKLTAAGVPVEYRCYEGLVHGFFSMSGAVDVARSALEDSISGLRRAFSAAQVSAGQSTTDSATA
ncbi:alpha/beta hydrolase [Polyangium aurulentum]|uniref:alpha/beta hydrolase n=1 Tax=Polyangium aurulentum TaxID=2567896 RepID=UPI0010ADC470|nr:alpha/beta hydrolase [Polyangium aurulentum]UQA62533.1 alpha/beta hydrolase [Polyangium aurulentum]